MKRGNTSSLGSAISNMLDTYRLKPKLEESKLITSWEAIMGKTIAKHTKKVEVRNKCLILYLDSPALKHELSMSKGKIVKLLNDEISENFINEVRIY